MSRTGWFLGTALLVALAASATGTATPQAGANAKASAATPQAGANAKASTATPQAGASGAKASAATATLEARSGSAVKGEATFGASGGKVTMKLRLSGLAPGPHAIHLHENGDCSDPEAKAAGGHWNPGKTDHGRWGEGKFHRGDIGNLEANAAGEATLVFSTDMWTIGGDPGTDIVGRSVIIHEKVDDFKTQPTGNAGGRLACGVIRVPGKK